MNVDGLKQQCEDGRWFRGFKLSEAGDLDLKWRSRTINKYGEFKWTKSDQPRMRKTCIKPFYFQIWRWEEFPTGVALVTLVELQADLLQTTCMRRTAITWEIIKEPSGIRPVTVLLRPLRTSDCQGWHVETKEAARRIGLPLWVIMWSDWPDK